MELRGKLIEIYRDKGLKFLLDRILKKLYREKLKPLTPTVTGEYNGIKVPVHIPLERINRPQYEKGLVDCMEKYIEAGDRVTVLGGGLGVTAVKAAELNGSPEKVKVYEPGSEQLQDLNRTLKLNNCTDIKTHQTVVGPAKEVYGSYKGAERKEASELGPCDVLEMDIEGAELEVIENIDIEPRIIIVETHGPSGASTDQVEEKLENKEYIVTDNINSNPSLHSKEEDVRVIAARRDN